MLLRSIKLHNFRQFKNETELEFSIDPSKNVSMILGENGSGKTSLAEAFTWALYGVTDFSDPVVLSRSVALGMTPGEKTEVSVEVHLTHSDQNYRIRRSQQYQKRLDGGIHSSSAVLNVAIKQKGQQEFLKNPELEVKQILPKELASYFFLNGEHIQRLTKELKRGKSQEFANAVENLLGLKAFLEAIEHFKPSKKYSVISTYNRQFDSNSNQEIAKLKELIPQKQERKNAVEARLSELDNEIELGEESCNELEGIIRDNARSTEYQNERDELKRKIERKENSLKRELELIFGDFGQMGLSFLSSALVNEALEFLASEEITDKGVPEINERTITYLIERGKCICGEEIRSGEQAHENLIELMEYIPPKSIGLLVSDFVNDCDVRVRGSESFFGTFSTRFSNVRDYQQEIDEHVSEMSKISETLQEMKDVGVYQSRLSEEQTRLRNLEDEKAELYKELGVLEKDISGYENELRKLALQDRKNARIETYKSYAQEIHKRLSDMYEQEETRVREMLEETVNGIFRKIYEGGMSISVDEKYRIKVLVDEVHGTSTEIETSTAQSTSVIFAFIAGIIELAKNFSSAQGVDQELLAASEPYPLVMDAPLSNFDKRRIETVCDTLPKVAEQVIILIKDTDGDLAEQYLGSIIGKRYRLERMNEVETQVVSR